MITSVSPLVLGFVEVRPRQASVLACVILAVTNEGLEGTRVLEGARYKYCGTE